MAAPRQGKTAVLADIVLRYPGPVVSTSVKPDVFALTSGVRSKLGHGPGVQPAGHRRCLLDHRMVTDVGLPDPQVAERRASAFAGAVSVKGTDGGGDTFWTSQAAKFMGAASWPPISQAGTCGCAAGGSRATRRRGSDPAGGRCRRPGAALSQLRSSSAQKTWTR